MYKTEKVSPDVVLPLRHKVLRPHLPFETSILPSDNDPDAIHLTLKNAYRLRGMATELSKQRKGFGAIILHGAMDHLKQKTDVEILWCNARVTAFGFYEKMGFTALGETFDTPNLGPHKIGYIEL